jgi:hypothetical protein
MQMQRAWAAQPLRSEVREARRDTLPLSVGAATLCLHAGSSWHLRLRLRSNVHRSRRHLFYLGKSLREIGDPIKQGSDAPAGR